MTSRPLVVVLATELLGREQQELDSELVVGSLHPSAPGRKFRGAPFFAPFSRVFSKG